MHLRLRHELLGGHRHVRVFTGPDVQRLALSGTLIFRQDEWNDEWTPFLARLLGQPSHDVLTVDHVDEAA